MKDVIHVDCLDNYQLLLTFEGGGRGQIDIRRVVPFDGVFDSLRDPVYFRQVQVNPDVGTIVWPNGADLCPDVLYKISQKVK